MTHSYSTRTRRDRAVAAALAIALSVATLALTLDAFSSITPPAQMSEILVLDHLTISAHKPA